MRIRPGRTRSLVAGIMLLVAIGLGLAMMSQCGSMGGLFDLFQPIWVIVALAGAGLAFYNAFSRRGVPLYEIDMSNKEQGAFCPQCGRPAGTNARFCQYCGASLRDE